MYRQATKYVGKNDQGMPYTEIQKYAIENPVDYQYYINLLFYQTNGFKDLSKAVSKEINTQNKTVMKNLEKVIRNQRSPESGYDFGNDLGTESVAGLKGLTVRLD